jgi:hypothetical protein
MVLAEALLTAHEESRERVHEGAYWRSTAGELLTQLIALLRALGRTVSIKMLHLLASPSDSPRYRLCADAEAWLRSQTDAPNTETKPAQMREVKHAIDFFREFDDEDGDSTARKDVLRYVADILRSLRNPALEEFVSPEGDSFPGFDAAIDEGRIVVLQLPLDQYGTASRQLGMLAISDFLAAARRRLIRAGANQERRLGLVLDRAEPYLSRELEEALPILRQARTFVFLSYLSRTQMMGGPYGWRRDEALRSHVATKLTFSPASFQEAEEASQRLGMRAHARSPWWNPFQREEVRVPYFTAEDLVGFRMGEFALVRFTGEGVEPPVRAQGIPAFEDPEIAALL